MSSSEASTRRRVKLYTLNDDRQWDDKGTGHVSALYTEQDNMALVVISETDGSYLLESKILPDTAYQKQQETLIVWSEGDNTDLALSFQEKVGCDDVWEKICAVQGKDPSVEITQEVVDESDDVDDADGYIPTPVQTIQPLSVPPCDFSHLEDTVEVIGQAVSSPPERERLLVLLESTNYLNQLADLFHKAEDLEEMESLHHLYEIMRQLILINKHSLYETLFADDMLMDVVGILEYNPSGRTRHRDFLRNKATFKEVLPLHNTDLVSKIHQTYRVQYIQECCLPPPCLFDEHTFSQLKAFVSLNKMEIIRALQEDEEFMRCLFSRLKSTDTDLNHRKELSMFVKEFCNISIQTDQKESFLSCLFQHGALRTAEVLLSIDDRDIKSAALEILQAFIEHQPSVVREYVYKENSQYRNDNELLINLMITQLLCDPDPELNDAYLLGYMLRVLIDPDNMNNPGVVGLTTFNTGRGEKTEFLAFFYKRCIGTLVHPVFENTMKDTLEKDDYHTALVLNNVLELLTFCIETHTYHMKNYCFNRDLLKRVLVLLQSSHKFLVLAALRLFRRVINMKEEFYNRYVIKNSLFKPILKLFVSNGHRYNLIDSAIIELFEYIRSEDITSLITHVVENYWDRLKNITYVQTFASLREAYDRTHRPNRPTMMGSLGQQATLDVRSLVNVSSARFQRDPRTLEVEEEQWFDQDEEEEEDEDDSHIFPSQSHTLVNGTNSSSPDALVGSTPDGLSSLPNFDSHSATSTPELLSLPLTDTTQTPLTSLTSENSPLMDVRDQIFSNSSPSTLPLLKRNQLDEGLINSDRPTTLVEKLRIQSTALGVDDTFSARSQLTRHTTPITINIKSVSDSPIFADNELHCGDSSNSLHTAPVDATGVEVTRDNSSDSDDLFVEDSTVISHDDKSNGNFSPPSERDECSTSTDFIPTSRINWSSCVGSKRAADSPSLIEFGSTSNKRLQTSDDGILNEVSVHNDLMTSDLPVGSKHLVSSSDGCEHSNENEQDSGDGSPIGLVDYSDEESEGEDVSEQPASDTGDGSSSAGCEMVSSSQSVTEVT